ncbi:hypothetical protein BC832DRAFT_541190 [Gaertneriomyces semiglobifer]|nr:hypothetical protein BC832DRAFT_541190 [Gaertneriomyces semiglobifer]
MAPKSSANDGGSSESVHFEDTSEFGSHFGISPATNTSLHQFVHLLVEEQKTPLHLGSHSHLPWQSVSTTRTHFHRAIARHIVHAFSRTYSWWFPVARAGHCRRLGANIRLTTWSYRVMSGMCLDIKCLPMTAWHDPASCASRRSSTQSSTAALSMPNFRTAPPTGGHNVRYLEAVEESTALFPGPMVLLEATCPAHYSMIAGLLPTRHYF